MARKQDGEKSETKLRHQTRRTGWIGDREEEW